MKNDIKSLVFFEDIKKRGGSVYKIGGVVRDFFLKKESKDLDLLVCGIPLDELEKLLSKHGRVDAVGKSFGVLKFKEYGSNEDIDIALPRTEKKVGDGHKGFEIIHDHTLSIEQDLWRRDLKLNSMAIDSEGNVIDPYGGMEDIKNETISLTNPDAFSDDPLRMLRAIGFSSRFDFNIENNTLQSIIENAYRIKEISGERIYIELEKIVSKGNKKTGLKLLVETGLFKEIFGKDFEGSYSQSNAAQDMPEFINQILLHVFDDPSMVYKHVLSGEVDGEKKIKALTLLWEEDDKIFNLVENRILINKMYKISPSSIDSNLLSSNLKEVVLSMKNGEFPLKNKDLTINGDDLLELGFKGKQIGDIISSVLLAIYKEKLKNNKTDILEYINNEKY